jgi:hypothetical protein
MHPKRSGNSGRYFRVRNWLSEYGLSFQTHRHSGLGLLTPAMVHYGQAENILRQCQEVLDVAYQLHPERFARSVPKPPALASEVWINRPDLEPLTAAIDSEKCEMRLKKDKSGDTVGRPSWRSSLPGDPGAKFFCEKPQHMKNSLNFANTCLKVVDTRRVYIAIGFLTERLLVELVKPSIEFLHLRPDVLQLPSQAPA